MAKGKGQSTRRVALHGSPVNNLSQLQREVSEIKTILGCWKFRRHSLLRKITVLKSFVASQVVYIPFRFTNKSPSNKRNQQAFFSIFYETIKRIKLNARS